MTATIDERATDFVRALSALKFDNAFNPYRDTCADHDRDSAPFVRRRNLELVLHRALTDRVQSVWIARDLGYRGGRRTGIALTDEIHLPSLQRLMGTPPLRRATKGPPMAERTAAVVWQMIRAIERPVFLWNVFPLHPHNPGDPMSNRRHTRLERTACEPLLNWLLETLCPERIVAVGRDAHSALTDMGFPALYVRHPSYGGQSEFISGIAAHYGMESVPLLADASPFPRAGSYPQSSGTPR